MAKISTNNVSNLLSRVFAARLTIERSLLGFCLALGLVVGGAVGALLAREHYSLALADGAEPDRGRLSVGWLVASAFVVVICALYGAAAARRGREPGIDASASAERSFPSTSER